MRFCDLHDALGQIDVLKSEVSRLKRDNEIAWADCEGKPPCRCCVRCYDTVAAEVSRLTKEREELEREIRESLEGKPSDYPLIHVIHNTGAMLDVLRRERDEARAALRDCQDDFDALRKHTDAARRVLGAAESQTTAGAAEALKVSRDVLQRTLTKEREIGMRTRTILGDEDCNDPRPLDILAFDRIKTASSPQANSSSDKLRLIRDFVLLIAQEGK